MREGFPVGQDSDYSNDIMLPDSIVIDPEDSFAVNLRIKRFSHKLANLILAHPISH